MDKTETPAALLTVAVQDLFDGESAWTERLSAFEPSIAHAGLGQFASEQIAAARSQADRLTRIAAELDSPPRSAPNIWLRAVLDDAERDTRTIAAGALLDIALVGAFRKGIQSERVSYETAIALAQAVGASKIAATLAAIRDEETQADAALATLLAALSAMLTS